MKSLLFAAAAIGLAACVLQAATGELPSKPGKPLSAEETKFVIDASQDGETEVRLGELAMKLGPSPQVRDFGTMMRNDHATVNAELKAICSRRGVILPPELDPDHQKLIDDLGKKSGSDFQTAYVDEMISAHKSAVSAFERAEKVITDAEIKAFIEKILPTLRHHLQSAENLKATGK